MSREEEGGETWMSSSEVGEEEEVWVGGLEGKGCTEGWLGEF